MRRTLTIALGLLVAAGCGGKEGERPAADYQTGGGAPATDSCAADDGLEFLMVTDFENGVAQRWWTSDDGSPDSTFTPRPGKESPDANELAKPRCGESQYALRIQASGLVVYGAAFGQSFLVEYPTGRDVSEWEGLSFWVKRNGDARGRSLFVAVNDRNTDSSARVSLRAAELQEGIETVETVPDCDDNSLIESEKCDRFGAGVPLPDQWTFISIPFDRMKQRGFGIPAPKVDVEALAGLNFSFEVGDWDFYLDDVAFYRHAASGD